MLLLLIDSYLIPIFISTEEMVFPIPYSSDKLAIDY